jgi:catechol 2,3-dioxygenase-like lactoylglutathione lyase family enzyme
MAARIRSTRDIIIRTERWDEAAKFYESVLGFPVTYKGETIAGFETGSFCLYVDKGPSHGPVFEFLVADVQAEKHRLLAAGCVLIEEDPSIPRVYVRDPYGMVFNIGHAGD